MDPIPVGILHSLSGTMAVSESFLADAALMAIHEINAAGGVLGKQIKAIVEDGCSDPKVFAAKAEKLIEKDGVATLFGCWTSASRKSVKPLVEKHNSLLWYPVQYEGLEQSLNIVYTGSCLNQQIEPALYWCLSQGAKCFFLVGSDYIFPRVANSLLRSIVEAEGGNIAGEVYQRLGSDDFRNVVRSIIELEPDFVFNTIKGSSNIAFFREYAESGATCPIMSFSFSELELQHVAEEAAGHYTCWSYFQSLDNHENQRFLKNYRVRWGADRISADPLVMAYSQPYLWCTCADKVGSFHTEAVLKTLPGQRFFSPAGELEIQPNNHVRKKALIGKARSDAQFQVIWHSDDFIEPRPWLGVETSSLKSKNLIQLALSLYPEYAYSYSTLKESEEQLEERIREWTGELEQSRERYRRLVESLERDYFIYSYGVDGVFTYVSPSITNVLGYTREEYLAHYTTFFTDNPINKAAIDYTKASIRGEKQLPHELESLHKDGSTRLLEVCEKPVFDENGSVVAVEGIAHDISEQRRVEETLRREKDFRTTLIESSPAFFVAIDPEGKTIMMNQAMLSRLGYERAEVIRADYLSTFVPESDHKPLKEIFRRIIHNKEEIVSENRVMCRDGREVLVEWHGCPVLDAKGTVEYFFGVGIDVTDRRMAEDQRRINEHRYREIFDATSEAIFIHDADTGRILDVNQTMLDMFGYDYEEALSLTIAELSAGKPPYSQVEAMQWLKAAIEQGPQLFEWRSKRSNGGWFWSEVALRSSIVAGERRVLAVVRDITDRKNAEEELRKSARDIERVNRLAIGREKRIIELKQAVNELSRSLGKPAPFDSVSLAAEEAATVPEEAYLEREALSGPSSTSPQLGTLINRDRMKQILDNFFATVGISSSIIDFEGEVIVESGSQRVCSDFHRRNEHTCRRCIESDTELAGQLKEGEQFAIYRCRNGLNDAASPIRIGGRHVANAFVGQFFVQEPDEAFFRSQAVEFKFEENAYLEALRQVPIVTEAKLPPILSFLTGFAELVGDMGLERLHQKEVEEMLTIRNRELRLQREAAVSLAEDADSARKAAEKSEEAFRESEERFTAFMEHLPAVAGLKDAQGRYLFINRAYAEELAIRPEELLGRRAADVFPPETAKVFFEHDAQVLSSQEPRAFSETILFGGEERQYISARFPVPAPGQGRSMLGFVSMDVTKLRQMEKERKELEAQLRQAQKMESIGRLAGGVAHDFNNLLQAILGYGEMALEEADPRSVLHEELHEILQSARRATTLVGQLLAFSRRQVLKLEDLALDKVVNDLAKMIGRVIGENIAINIRSTPGLGVVRADRGQIEQVMMNLCVNARDAMPEGGEITISMKNVELNETYCEDHLWAKPGHYVLLSVTDTGYGMDAEIREHIFEPFFTTKEVGKGTGLGLATVYGIIKQHGGMIDVYSEPGIGTEFKIYLSQEKTPVAAGEKKTIEPPPKGTETILLAEDDDGVRRLTTRILENAGYTVLMARDGEEALRVFDANSEEIDLLLLDVVMPKGGGRSVFDYVQEKHQNMPVLFASGYASGMGPSEFRLDDGMVLIHKPYSQDTLLRTIRRVLGVSRESLPTDKGPRGG